MGYPPSRTMKKSAELLEEIRKDVENLESHLPEQVDAMAVARISKLPSKALIYRETLAWRMAELSRDAYEHFVRSNLVSAIVLTRAAVETSAALWYLRSKVTAALHSGTVGDIDEYLMRMLVGVATDPAPMPQQVLPRPIRVKSFLAAVEKDIPEFRHHYGVLCEYAHPNWGGTSFSYSTTDMEKRIVYFSKNPRNVENTKAIGTINLSVALRMFEISYNGIADLLPRFIEICEAHLKGGLQSK